MVFRALPLSRGPSSVFLCLPMSTGFTACFKKQIPRRPSPHIQSSVVSNIQLSHGHSLGQILTGRQGVIISHHYNSLKDHSDLQRQRHCLSAKERTQNQKVWDKAFNCTHELWSETQEVTRWPVGVETGKYLGLVS